jgi:predicted metal-dependent phosphoesterase TrpH
MPAGSPFTVLCQALARGPAADRADLHLHSTASDGTYTPTQLVELGRRCLLRAIALTDHDTLAGLDEARAAARGSSLEVITGVEITTRYAGHEIHLLGYFVDPAHPGLSAALESIRLARRGRFLEMVERLRGLGVSIEVTEADLLPSSLGRRTLAELLVRQGKASSVREAFQRWLHDRGRAAVPKESLPTLEAISHVRAAGGVASWAHPPYDQCVEHLAELAAAGLGAVEVVFPNARPGLARQMRERAMALGLAVSGGSDCHGPGGSGVGSHTLSSDELERLRCSVPSSTKSSKV